MKALDLAFGFDAFGFDDLKFDDLKGLHQPNRTQESVTCREISHLIGLWQDGRANSLIFPAQIHTCCKPTFSTDSLESFRVILSPFLQEDGKILPTVPLLPAPQRLLVEGGHVRVPGGDTPSDAGLPELGLESKFLQAPADVESHASPSQGGGQPPGSASQRCSDEHFGEGLSRGGDNPTGIACAGHGAAVDQPPPSMQRLFSTHREILTHFFIYWVNFSMC